MNNDKAIDRIDEILSTNLELMQSTLELKETEDFDKDELIEADLLIERLRGANSALVEIKLYL